MAADDPTPVAHLLDAGMYLHRSLLLVAVGDAAALTLGCTFIGRFYL